jgi:C1A family cysteine protease
MDLDDGQLSVQQILDCDSVGNGYDTKDMGCTGGDPITAMAYIQQTGGLVMDDTYPYTSYYGVDTPYGPLAGTKSSSTDSDTTCKKLKKSYVVTIKKYYQIASEEDMVAYVSSTGPLSVCVDATEWQTYSYGVVTSCGTNVNHCVQISGYNTEGYWIIRNSWGQTWGEQGYLYVVSGRDACGITTEALYTKTSKA